MNNKDIKDKITQDVLGQSTSTFFSDSCIAFQRSSNEATPVFEFQGLKVLFWGRIFNRDALIQEFNVGKTAPNQKLIVLAWLAYGFDFPAHIKGEYSAVIVNIEQEKTILVRDPFGVKPLYYSLDNNCLLAATSIAALLKHPHRKFKKNIEWVKRYIVSYALAADFEETAYLNIHKVPPAHVMEITNGEVTHKSRYMEWKNDPPKARRWNNKHAEQHRKLLDQAISRRVDDKTTIGIENSGGLDSASIITLLGQNHTNELVSLSTIHFDLEEEYISDLNDQANVKPRYQTDFAEWDRLALIRQQIDTLGVPSGQDLEIHPQLYQTAISKHAMTQLFSGYGGDQVATTMGQEVPIELCKDLNYPALWQIIPGHPLKKPFRFLKTLWNKGRDPEFDKWCIQYVKNSYQRAVLKKELFKDEKLCADLDKYALVPLYLDNVNETIINTHFQAPHLTNRFETHALMADSMGFEIQWPLWDVDLIQNFLSTPNIEKMGPKMQRRFLHRRAVADVVPDHIRNINSKFTGEPLKTISQSDEERKTYNDMAIEFKKSLHPDIQALVDMPKLEKMRMRALDFIGKQYSHEEYPFELCTLQLYALDYWYKTGEA